MSTLTITNPATGATIRTVPADTPDDVTAKVARARAAQPAWRRRSLDERIGIIRAFREIIERDKATLAALTTSEVGKPLGQSKNELNGLLGRIDFFLAESAKTLAPEQVFSEGTMVEVIDHEPLGVVANISAWNYPYFVGSNVFVPALIAGNTVLYKPSEFATLTGLALADALHEAGVPKDVFIPVVGGGEIGAALTSQPVDGVFFTGSYATGKKIADAAGKSMTRVQLELGGKDPVYVADDVDAAAAAAATADGAFYNTGQSCCAVERIYVHDAIYDQFVDAFVREVGGFVVGDPTDEKTYIGPLTRAAQLAVLDEQIADAKKRGAKVAAGGQRLDRPGNYFAPTVLLNVDHSMAVMREESFGPVIGIQRVKDDAEAASLMNDTQYGLTAGVYTKDRARAEKLLRDVDAGSAYWNCCDRVSPRLPWSGRGHSGLGLTLSRYGILAFTKPKAWHLRSPG
ncbi:MAG: aldehyde dehydrogenase family protein [Polyangiaceae bacterium]|nr:aldehyde dehydrogenase family protein [Polyangiaceae bacterium]